MNTKQTFGIALAFAVTGFALGGSRAADAVTASANTLVIHADQPGAQISRNIYGQFSEHLGHCIYGGIWVGEQPHPQHARHPQRRGRGAEKNQSARHPLAGRLFRG